MLGLCLVPAELCGPAIELDARVRAAGEGEAARAFSRRHQVARVARCSAMPRIASLDVVRDATEQIYRDGGQRMSERSEEIDPGVVEHIIAIRDRFGVRGLRDADALIREEIKLAEEALQGLPSD